MITGAAVVPAAPVLVPGVGRGLDLELLAVARSCRAVVDRLPAADAAVVVAAGTRGVHDRALVDLRGLGRPDVHRELDVHTDLAAAVARATGAPQLRTSPLPIDLACLALQVGTRWPVVPIAVSATAEFATHVATGAAVVEAAAELGVQAVLVVAGDGSASLSPRAPRPGRDGAHEWQTELLAAFAEHRTARLAALGPERAADVAARGWAPMSVLHGVTARARLGVVLRRHAAPRGVGYVVAHGS